jgi:hypothetical protein
VKKKPRLTNEDRLKIKQAINLEARRHLHARKALDLMLLRKAA